jgi:TonB family protein
VSAAQKLNSRSFDFVLVDCENLPAAKLIFDVCRRGKNGINPVPIAIVDGRAGLPTAFRLGAELILTKPVAKDQARSTIRTAISRLRREEPARAPQAPEAAPLATETAVQPQERAQAAAAAVSSQPVKRPDITPATAAETTPAPAMSTAAEGAVAAPLPQTASSAKPTTTDDLFKTSKPTPPEKLSDDPVMADLERGDVAPPPAPVVSSHQGAPPKSRGHLVALLILVLAGGGVYAAWMYQPGFRALVQPQIDRALALAGIASQQNAVPAPLAPAKIPAQAPAKPTPATPITHPTASATDGAKPKGASAATDSPNAAPASTPATATPESPADSRKTEAASSPDSELPGDQGTVILSSKGAENRLVHHVPPTLPAEATAQGLKGTVTLKTAVDENGNVESVSLVEGNPTLAAAAILAVKQWRYRPYVRDGKTLPFQTVVLVDF